MSPIPVGRNSKSGKRFRVGIRLGLTLGLGTLVMLAVLSVLGLGLWSGQRNTTSLLRESAQVMVSLIRRDIAGQLRPVEDQVSFVSAYLEAERPTDLLDPDGPLTSVMTGALAATPATAVLALVTPDLKILAAKRRADGATVVRDVLDEMPEMEEHFARAAQGFSGWSQVIWSRQANRYLLVHYRPVWINGRYVGAVIATVPTERLARVITDGAAELSGSAFLLNADNRLLAHPAMLNPQTDRTSGGDLPDNIDDPALDALLSGRFEPIRDEDNRFDSLIVENPDGAPLFVLLAPVEGYTPLPWKLAISFPLRDVADELLRLLWAAVAGLGVLVVSVLISFRVARRLSEPLIRLSRFAERARSLDLDGLEPLPRSRFRELDDAAEAMNAMIVGLRWFETYLPKRLVLGLMQRGGAEDIHSDESQITVMFTDIVGFTRLTEHWPAQRTAAFLNHHFDLLAREIEATGGTIDKFIGDAVMAFWGAPEAQPDHAARAVAAARAIARVVEQDNRTSDAPISLRIGLHTGPVVVGNIGARARMNYTIVGDTVNTANRLESTARPPANAHGIGILASTATIQAAGITDSKPLGRIPLKGREETIEVHVL